MKYFRTVPSKHLQQWNHRQRKKLRLGEFQEFCFPFDAKLKHELSDDELNQLIEAFYSFLEQHSLNAATFSDVALADKMSGVVQFEGRGGVTNEHRTVVLEWLRAHPLIASCEAGDLVDAWHGWD
ncbi:50S ribosome-binding protein YggL [Undibacterium cyanobacteriorum]|uniref:50S ribosome-binding protein YggL n=1 Tax=Undibacterium cyanobacteriorum TaxID=3073561 RepID=A0ABY9RJD6_9BURK|nr:50S ribosome-binding protein YggL [Undibacterium sp. 20NA77.5]WMW80775.1 50S ribosome-binding protein YggL [Undibacterium sp. 20NA77.5]